MIPQSVGVEVIQLIWIDPANSEGVAIWSGIEMNISIFCACLVVIRPVLAKIFPDRFGSKDSRHTFPGQAFSATASAIRRLTDRASHLFSRERISGDDIVPMQTLHGKTSNVGSNGDIKQQDRELEGIRVDHDIDLSYKPASRSGSESELVSDRSVWITSPGGRRWGTPTQEP